MDDDDDLTAGSAGSRRSLISERGSVDSYTNRQNNPQSPLTPRFNSKGAGGNVRERFYTGETPMKTDSSLHSLSALSDGDWEESSKATLENATFEGHPQSGKGWAPPKEFSVVSNDANMSQVGSVGEEKKDCSTESMSSALHSPTPYHMETALELPDIGGASYDQSLNDEYDNLKKAINPKSSSLFPSAAFYFSPPYQAVWYLRDCDMIRVKAIKKQRPNAQYHTIIDDALIIDTWLIL